MTEAYPLQWPHGRPRKPVSRRKGGTFHQSERHYGEHGSWRSQKALTVSEAIKRLQNELDRISARLPVISSNLELRLDGLPRSGQRRPDDPGVAVYFQLQGKPICLPCDTYDSVEANIAAVAKHIEATRAIERYGVATIAEQFTGFAALPAPDGAEWWEVLKLPRTASREDIEAAFKALARERHPDRGGSDHQMAELNAARAKALQDIGARA